jgi:hypothetical protein
MVKIINVLGYLIGIIIGFMLVIFAQEGYCHFNPSYNDMYSPCFDTDLRCEWECSEYGLIYQNKTNPEFTCECDCGTGYVSMCSGFFYEYNMTRG